MKFPWSIRKRNVEHQLSIMSSRSPSRWCNFAETACVGDRVELVEEEPADSGKPCKWCGRPSKGPCCKIPKILQAGAEQEATVAWQRWYAGAAAQWKSVVKGAAETPRVTLIGATVQLESFGGRLALSKWESNS